jgi:hypothetical protein
MHGTHNVRLQG